MPDPPKTEAGTDLIGIGRIGVQLIQTGEKFIEMLFGPYLRERGESMADPVRQRRHNLVLIAGMAKEQVGDAEMRPIPGRILFPLANAAMNEDSPDMQRRWAALLASAITTPDSISPAFPRILSDLSPTEARILDLVFEHHMMTREERKRADWSPTVQLLMDKHHMAFHTAVLCLSNLDRLGLVTTTHAMIDVVRASLEPRFVHVGLTPFGASFLDVCRPNKDYTQE